MKFKKTIIISTLIVFICIVGFEIYKAQPTNTLEFLASSERGGTLTIKGKDITIVENIFLNEIEYADHSLSKKFPQYNDDYIVLCYPKNSNPEHEDFILNFGIQDNQKENEYIVCGNILGGEDKHGYIKQNAYRELSTIIKKYQAKQKNT